MRYQSDSNNIKLLIYAIHPIMYQAPIFSELEDYKNSNLPWLDFTVYFGSKLSLKETYHHTFTSKFKNDYEDILRGYNFKFLKNFTLSEKEGFFSRINLGIIPKIMFGKYDVVLMHGYNTLTSIVILLSCLLSGKKIIFRGESILRGDEDSLTFKNRLKIIYLNIFLSLCDKVLYSCSGNKDFFLNYNVPIEKLIYIPCAVNNNFFQDNIKKLSPSIQDIKNSIGIKEKDLVISMCCSFTRRKRPIDLIKTAIEMNNENIFLLFIGDGPQKSLIHSELKNTSIRYHITGFLGQNQISKYYLISDVSVVLSDYDPSPKAMNEAMNFSNCIIATHNVGTANDLIKKNHNGFIINAGDVSELKIILTNLESNRDDVKNMGKRSLDIVSSFNYLENAKAIEKAIVSIQENV
tara:strand:+ start:13816 stop:15036 length:1221 start_codon:yes stop_codon:yes gene_type:complete